MNELESKPKLTKRKSRTIKPKDTISKEEKSNRLIKQNDADTKIGEFFKLQCQLCQAIFSNFNDLRAHYRSAHLINRGYIPCCNKKFTSRTAILEHIEWHTNPEIFRYIFFSNLCFICFNFQNLRCKICLKIYNDQIGLKLHMQHHAQSEEKVFSCDVCGRNYTMKHNLLQHLRLAHFSEKNHKCPECNKSYVIVKIMIPYNYSNRLTGLD